MWPPTPFALLAFVFHMILFFCTENRQDKACRQLPHPTLLLGITTNLQSRHPVGLAATPAAPRELGATGNGTHIITLSHWHSELPAPGQGARG